jgi:Ni/Co efflux regulator RcnB
MTKTLLAMTSAFLLAGTMSFTASAQSGQHDRDYRGSDNAYDSRYDNRYDDRYDSRRDNRDDRNDDRDDDRYDQRYNGRYQNGYADMRGIRDSHDQHHKGKGHKKHHDNRRYMSRHSYNAGRYYQPRNYRYTRYNIGSQLPRGYYGNNYYVDYRPYGLAPPPRGYRWNRVGNDAYLVSVTNGIIWGMSLNLFR